MNNNLTNDKFKVVFDRIVTEHPDTKKDMLIIKDNLFDREKTITDLRATIATLEAYITTHNIERRESQRKQLQPSFFHGAAQ